MAEGEHEPVLIAGAGPVGLAGALELARLGHPVRIVDKAEARSAHSKAIAVNPRSMDLLEPSGALERIMAESIRINRISMHSGYRRLFTIDLSRLEHPRNYVLSLPQSETEAILEDTLAERGVKVERRTELTQFDQDGGAVHATLVRDGQQEIVSTPYLLGADGAHSAVRHGLGLEFPGGVYPDRWEVADLSLDTPLAKDEVNIYFLPGGGIFFVIPLPGEGLYRIGSNATGAAAERLPPGSKVLDSLWVSEFTINHRLVERYAEGRAFLAGDAAHLHSPAGGRGMNLGIEDATEFARRVVGGGLEAYAADRHRAGERVLRDTDRLTRMGTTTSPVVRALRDHLLPLLIRREPIQRRIRRDMMGLHPG